jgi:hypothetical protein
MPSLHLSAKEAATLAIYLLRAQLDNPQVVKGPPLRSPGLRYQLYDNTAFPNVALATFDTVKPTSEGMLDTLTLDIPTRKSQDQFGVKFTGLIAIPRDGKYTFSTRSDDGSRLFIDDKEVVSNDGHHPPNDASGEIELHAGDHNFTVTFFDWIGGETLEVSWQGPGIPKQSLPPGVLFKAGGRPMVPLGHRRIVQARPAESRDGPADVRGDGLRQLPRDARAKREAAGQGARRAERRRRRLPGAQAAEGRAGLRAVGGAAGVHW